MRAGPVKPRRRQVGLLGQLAVATMDRVEDAGWDEWDYGGPDGDDDGGDGYGGDGGHMDYEEEEC